MTSGKRRRSGGVLMSSKAKFNVLLSLLTIGVMAARGLLLAVTVAVLYGPEAGWRDRFSVTLTMTTMGTLIAIAQTVGFYWRQRQGKIQRE
jgi:protein-S-isoprenylcysteine O-methyltransferase Ste14